VVGKERWSVAAPMKLPDSVVPVERWRNTKTEGERGTTRAAGKSSSAEDGVLGVAA
jgi:hypothetical protein